MDMKTVCIALVVVILLWTLFVEIRKRTLFARIEHLFADQKYQEVVQQLDKPLARVVYPRYNLLFMRLNAQLGLDNTADATRTVEEMLQLRMNKEQQMALFTKAFAFYVEKGDKKRAGAMLERIEGMNEKALARASRETFEIVLNKSTAFIGQMESQLKDSSPLECMRLCQLLAAQYENRGDKRAAERYIEMARASFEEASRRA